MTEALFGILGLLAGGAVAWFFRKAREAEALGRERQERATLEVRLAEAQKNLAEQRSLLEAAQARLEDAFKAMAGEALKSNNEAFLQLAEQTLKGHLAEATGDIELRRKAVEDLVAPLRQALQGYHEKADTLERERQQAYGGLTNLMQTVALAHEKLKQETGNLVSALRQPNVRGRWGELTLRRVVELAGLTEHCDFTEQETRDAEEGALRPDLVVHLPGRREIVVDAKTVLSAYLDAHEAANEEAREAALARHAAHLRERVRNLSSKRYWERFGRSADFVVLFIPGEPFLSAAVQRDPALLDDAMADRVVLATPSTLVALMKAVAYGWRQEQLAEKAQEIAEHGKRFFEAVSVWVGHLQKLRRAVWDTVVSFDEAQGSLERNVLPKAREMKKLGVSSDREVPSIEAVERVPRAVEDLPRE